MGRILTIKALWRLFERVHTQVVDEQRRRGKDLKLEENIERTLKRMESEIIALRRGQLAKSQERGIRMRLTRELGALYEAEKRLRMDEEFEEGETDAILNELRRLERLFLK